MYIKRELSFRDLEFECWSGAVDTLATIAENDCEEQLMNLLEELFSEGIPSMTEINDFLWFESDYIFECLGIEED